MGSEGVPSMVVEVMLVAAVELTDASSWWHEIDDSPAWQDCISYTLVVLYGIVAAVALVSLRRGLCTLFNFAVRYVVFIFYQNVQRLKLEIVQHILLDMSSLAFFTTYALLAHVVSTNGLKPSFYTINIVVYVVQ
ncbi:Tobamovirus multiplication protein 3, partial [Glycine soja]